MLELFLPIAMLAQSTPATPADLPPQPEPAVAREAAPQRVYVQDTSKAARIESDNPDLEICVRSLVPGSRVKARTVCQNKAAWKAYVEAQEAMNREWDMVGKGFPPETEFVGPVGS
ncbi:hypothetical protein [Parerythrobacter jejuensis]|uniref:UrcA family protein n=1 Tax=Parerythrobacter jejuensis TaxID=795812 RepID=A0A845AQN2_9SPHN|nr:hypothetical protein [Parerythrobacter jejuensis]MXP31493.1 hypothetical protein [Parerythrobacter jejuensis]